MQISELNSASENYSCPQSEPVKRKVYEGQDGLAHRQLPPWLRNSDSDCNQDQQVYENLFFEKHYLKNIIMVKKSIIDFFNSQLQTASAASSYSQLRKQVLIETLQGLKQSLEDQSAALSKLNCLRPV